MKGQYLFYSLLPGVTVTLLGIQPSFADSVQVEEANFDFWNFVISRKVTSQTDVSANVLKPIYLAQEPSLQSIVYKNTYVPKVINQQVEIGLADRIHGLFNPISKTSINFADFNLVDTSSSMTSLFGQDLANAIAKNTLTNVTTYTPQSVNVKERVVKPSLVAQHLANLNAIAKKKQLQFQLTVTNTH